MLNIRWCQICQAVTAWHFKGFVEPIPICDRCGNDPKGRDTVLERVAQDVNALLQAAP